ncbi:MAG TPA: cellulose synthase subunit BcsC-related outer membrane protein [Rhodocyclaceae bacterium]|nr:cellulose synthase subunit BcsC-related outer membrane protein [Rhodocyclaceae bacterium]
MRTRLMAAALGLSAGLLPWGATAADSAQAVGDLLQRARLWQARNRPDLARQALDKLFRVAPDDPASLALLAELQVKDDDREGAARTLARLQAAAPGHPAVGRVQDLLRLATADRLKLRQARSLARSGRAEAALAALRSLYPEGPPSGELALEYWQLMAATPNGWEAARAGFAQLLRDNPDHPRYRLALAEHETSRPPVRREALGVLAALSTQGAVGREARAAWGRAVRRLDLSEASIPLLEAYLAEEPGDTAVQEKLQATRQAVEARRRLLADPAWQARLAGLALLDGGNVEAAEGKLLRALAARPDDPETVGGMGLVRLRQGHHAEARGYFRRAAELDPGNRGKWTALEATARYWGLLKEAADAREAGEYALARDKIAEARQIDPREPNALVGLARILAAEQRPGEAMAAYRQALALAPEDTGALGGLIELQFAAGLEAEADALLADLPGEVRRSLAATVDGLRAGLLREKAARAAAAGRPDEAVARLEEAIVLAPADPWLRYRLARLYAARGEGARGRALFDPMVLSRPADAGVLHALALYQSGQDQDGAALATLERVPREVRSPALADLQRRLWVGVQVERARGFAAGGDTGRALALLDRTTAAADRADLQESVALAQAEVLRRAGRPAAAREALAPFVAAHPDRLRPLHAQARLLRAEGRLAEAEAVYRRIQALAPADRDAALALIDVQVQTGRRPEALAGLAALLGEEAAAPEAVDFETRVALVGVLMDLEDFDAAARRTRELLDAAPRHPRLLAYAGQLARRDGRVDEAADYLQASLAEELAARARSTPLPALSALDYDSSTADPAPGLQVEEAPAATVAGERRGGGDWRHLAELLDRRQDRLAGAVDWKRRDGTPGLSRYEAQEVPLEWKRAHVALGSLGEGQTFYRADLVRVSAGSLDLAGGDASRFGSVLACQPRCTGQASQNAAGVAFSLGFEGRDLQLDFGTTPLGFPVSGWVGGIRKRGDLGGFSYSVDLSRRPVTSSLLSYAGTRDPNGGAVWGGVQATGARFGLSWDQGGDFGFWSSLGLHRLAGRNVAANDRLQLMAGGYRRLVNEDDRLLTVGLTAMAWRLSENAGEFTFGHGGYYSPESYRSLALPLTWGRRTARFSYVLRGAVSRSWSRTAAADYFPTDAALQARAQALQARAQALQGQTGVDPHYSAGSGGGTGRSFAAAWEYQLGPQLYLGGRLEIERSEGYAPDRLLFYFRHALGGPGATPVSLPPEPVLPTSAF